MAPIIVQVPVREGSAEFIEVEVDRRDIGDSVDLVSDDGDGKFAKMPYTLASSLSRVLPALNEILLNLRAGAHAPDEVEMELGLKIGGETGIVFAKGTAEATIAVKMVWQKPNRSESVTVGST